MKLKLEGFNPECFGASKEDPTSADLAVDELNSVLLNDWGKLDRENGELWLWDFTFKRLAPELEKSIVKILEAMKATPDQIIATRKQIQDLLEGSPQN